jgi:hypothetical protein
MWQVKIDFRLQNSNAIVFKGQKSMRNDKAHGIDFCYTCSLHLLCKFSVLQLLFDGQKPHSEHPNRANHHYPLRENHNFRFNQRIDGQHRRQIEESFDRRVSERFYRPKNDRVPVFGLD